MPTARATARNQKALDDLWRRTLSQISTVYGRLVYLASLRNSNSGRYEHYGLALSTSSAEANRVLRRSHEMAFQEWVSFRLEEKKADLDLYISGLEQTDKTELVEAWLRLTPYKNLVPASIQGAERLVHISDFEALLGLLKNVYGVASPHPAA